MGRIFVGVEQKVEPLIASEVRFMLDSTHMAGGIENYNFPFGFKGMEVISIEFRHVLRQLMECHELSILIEQSLYRSPRENRHRSS